MDPTRSRQIQALFQSALAVEPTRRADFLNDACGSDEALLREVEYRLASEETAGNLLEVPALRTASLPERGAQPETAAIEPSGITVGRAFSHYEILEKLGAGGMGAVYKARDARLGRTVAIKVVNAEFTQRFEREARAISALNHPHICTLHDVGEYGGTPYLVMEYVEGKPLSGPLPAGEALRYAIQVCEALAAAHKAGIVHRDLKPDNILLTSEGSVKVLDFGLAKRESSAAPDTPTLASVTQQGVVTGTPAYMSPEQAQGEPVDARSDIFSFGAVLYELLSGRRAFRRETTGATLATVIALEPPPLREAPPEVARIVAKMLAKKRESRYQSAEDLLADMRAAAQPGTRWVSRRWWLVLAAALAIVIAGYAVIWRAGQLASTRSAALRTEFSQLTSQPGIEWFPSLSPDGKWLVYGGASASGHHIYLQAVGGQNPLDLTRDSEADDDQPAFSPDGEHIAFRSSRNGGGIFVMGRTGEAVRRLTSLGFHPSWSPDGTHLAITTENVELYPQNMAGRSELWTIALNTGETRRLSEGDAVLASWSPHNFRIAYTGRQGHPVQGDIWTIPVVGGTPARVTSDPARDWNPVWSPDGKYLYFASDRSGNMNLWRVRIDEASGKTLGEPEPITTPAPYFAHASLSADGKHIVYTSALITANIQQLSLDASGATKGETAWVTTGSRRWSSPDPSPDGEWIAFYSLTQPEGHLYIARPDGSGLRQITDGAVDRLPRWSPDSKWIACFSTRSRRFELWKIRPDASGLQQLTEGGFSYFVWSPDGSRIATNSSQAEISRTHVVVFDPNRPWKEQTPETLPLLDPPSDRFDVISWSPDGRFLAGQVSGEHPGIAMYSMASRTYQRLTDFGEWPVWLPDSRRVLFVANGSAFYILDTSSRRVRKIFTVTRDVIGPPRITRDGKKAYYSRRVTESDVWLCTLR